METVDLSMSGIATAVISKFRRRILTKKRRTWIQIRDDVMKQHAWIVRRAWTARQHGLKLNGTERYIIKHNIKVAD